MDAMDNSYSEADRKRFECLQKRLRISQEEEEDDTYHFLMSVRNPLKSLPLDRQMFIRLKIQELVYNEINSQNQQSRTYEVSQDVKPPRIVNAGVGAVGVEVGLGGSVTGLGESVTGADTKGSGDGGGGCGGGGGSGGGGGGGGGGSGSGGGGGGAAAAAGGVGGVLEGGQTVNDMSNHPASLLHNCTTEGSSEDTFFG